MPYIKVNVDNASAVAEHFNIQSMPSFHIINKEGVSVADFKGAAKLNVDKAIAALKEKVGSN